MEGQVFPDVAEVGIGDQGGLTEPALALAVLALEQVAGALAATEDLARTSHLEALGNGFACLCFSRDSRHGARRLGGGPGVARGKSDKMRVGGKAGVESGKWRSGRVGWDRQGLWEMGWFSETGRMPVLRWKMGFKFP